TSLVNYTLASVTGRLSDRFGPRIVIGAGAVAMGVGLALTAFIHNMYVGYVTYGVGVGLGAACAYVPTLALVGGWFAKRRNTALGIAAAGTGCGTLATPPIAAALITRYGWRTTDLILGLVAALLLSVCAWAADRPILTPATAAKRSIGRMIFSAEFILLYASWLLATTALFVPFVLLAAYARDRGNSAVDAAFLLSCIGGVSIVGRLGVGVLGDRFGVISL